MSENDITVPVEGDNVVQLFPEIELAEHPAGIEMTEWAFSNDKENPHIQHLFHMLYNATFRNKIGVMHALDTKTEKVVTLIVGVEKTDEGIITWPLARVLTEDEQGNYKAPTGTGDFL